MENEGIEEFTEADPDIVSTKPIKKIDTSVYITDSNVLEDFNNALAQEEQAKYLKSIEAELPNHGIAEVNQKQAYALNHAIRKELLQRVTKAHEAAFLEFSNDYPKEASELKLVDNTRVSTINKHKVPYKAVYSAIMDCLLDRNQTLKTQKAILEKVKFLTATSELNANLWKLPLMRFSFAQLNKRISDEGLKISLANCKNLSDVRKRVQAYFSSLKGELEIKAQIVFTEKTLVVNGSPYNISSVKVGNSEYRRVRVLVDGKRQWLRLDALKALLVKS